VEVERQELQDQAFKVSKELKALKVRRELKAR
jgi:hypothetical protein